jgi:hypothetical protein
MATLLELWGTLEESGPLHARLAALAELEERLPNNEPEFVDRMQRVAFFERGPLGRAVQKVLLRWRRKAFHRETVSSSPTLKNYEEKSRADLAVRALKDPGASARLDFLEKAAREEIFDAAPVLANRLLLESDERTAGRMAEVLGMLGRASHLLALKRACRHDSALVRRGAVLGLGHQVGLERTQLLIERLGDKDRGVREAAKQQLEETPREEILDQAEKIPAQKFPDLKCQLMRLIGDDLALPRVVQLMRRYLVEPEPRVYSEALLALIQIDDEHAQRRLETLRSVDDPRIQKVVAMATRLQSQRAGRPGSRP